MRTEPKSTQDRQEPGRRIPGVPFEVSSKHLRYVATSAITVGVGQGTLALGFGLLGWNARLANLVSFSIATMVGYLINRYWTWQVADNARIAIQGAWFWGLSLIGLALSQLAVSVAEDLVTAATGNRALQTAAVMAASLTAFGLVWIGKFFVLDKVVFAGSRQKP